MISRGYPHWNSLTRRGCLATRVLFLISNCRHALSKASMIASGALRNFVSHASRESAHATESASASRAKSPTAERRCRFVCRNCAKVMRPLCLESRVSHLASRVSRLASRISRLASRVSHLASRVSRLASRVPCPVSALPTSPRTFPVPTGEDDSCNGALIGGALSCIQRPFPTPSRNPWGVREGLGGFFPKSP